MKSHLRVLAVTVGLFCAASGFAQTAATAVKPSASASAAASTSVIASPSAAAKPSASASAAAPMAKPGMAASAPASGKATPAPMAKASTSADSKATLPATAAAGGGNGKVWVNTNSKAYHCEGAKFYGKTKAGEYMTEADAKAKGNHAENGKACAK